ncbi:HAD-IA family hydrolase [Maritimibacter sp. DP1N21-5]|uniref:HAD-IA family hydrolase n=1 Tax=Maritimibacter sp. DP1N21-5 TaxID=2836867 RepID=UPI001C4519A2|nr:HAD-IA family hydrolase [Maritimibacter sp. DP1N21-5]MBV7409430.1 HAD-IA family hydrolase [Maritimibacter sp. DP1N21-5]
MVNGTNDVRAATPARGTVIFDLDGTLADTSRDLIASANACFARRGLDAVLDPDADAGVAFHGGRAMLRLGYERLAHDGGWMEEDYPFLLNWYGANIDTHTRMYPGAVAAVEGLRAQGYAVGVCTNKPEGLAEVLLSRLGVRDLFASLVGADTLTVRKPDPAPYVAAVERSGGTVERSVLVGDTSTDRDTARAAGVPCVLVTFGPSGDRVLTLGPEAHIGHFDELAKVVEGLLT